MSQFDEQIDEGSAVAVSTPETGNGHANGHAASLPLHLQPDTGPEPVDGYDYVGSVIASLNLVSDDGEPMESTWHRRNMTQLIDQIEYHFGTVLGRTDYYVGGNMFLYFSAARYRNRDFRGPDFFFVSNSHRWPDRDYWFVWNEDRTPDVIIELASESTVDEDHGVKFNVYRDTLKVGNYFIYDRKTRVLEGWRLEDESYVPIPLGPNDRLYCNKLNLWLGTLQGTENEPDPWLRFFDANGLVLPLPHEAERQRAEAEKQRAEAEKQRAEAEKQRAEAEKLRADAAEAKAARLEELLRKAGLTP